ncbi:MAG TPA: hypothetical protein VK203_14405 [Nostocaceae cyanobacterium]|nr:hypothetical protein [Kamptonema sp.]HLO86184.1 hypothetical protein [Nostocaceae cyanobacterium]
MKLRLLITGLLIVFLVSCREIKNNTTVSSTPESSRVAEPRVSSSSNTSTRKQISEPINSPVRPQLSVGEAAQLRDSQVQELVSLEKNNNIGRGFKVLLPTYLPLGFRVDKLELNDNNYPSGYTIVYRNSKNNSCFRLTGDNGQWGAPPLGYNTVEALSPILGKVILEYTEFDQEVGGSLIKFRDEPIMKEQTGYSFISSPSIAPSCRNSISPQEAVKIVESFQYLNS